mmetsp:Transcript_14355/g.54146  ORF Transcript_14355/g.54146 Transcript_14355/m.54146 type:complete len:256 (+) Transcript_14355:4661-5428(+)
MDAFPLFGTPADSSIVSFTAHTVRDAPLAPAAAGDLCRSRSSSSWEHLIVVPLRSSAAGTWSRSMEAKCSYPSLERRSCSPPRATSSWSVYFRCATTRLGARTRVSFSCHRTKIELTSRTLECSSFRRQAQDREEPLRGVAVLCQYVVASAVAAFLAGNPGSVAVATAVSGTRGMAFSSASFGTVQSLNRQRGGKEAICCSSIVKGACRRSGPIWGTASARIPSEEMHTVLRLKDSRVSESASTGRGGGARRSFR